VFVAVAFLNLKIEANISSSSVVLPSQMVSENSTSTVIASVFQRLPWRPPLACGWAGVAPKAPVPQAREAIF
jgi:hypothetical protein